MLNQKSNIKYQKSYNSSPCMAVTSYKLKKGTVIILFN